MAAIGRELPSVAAACSPAAGFAAACSRRRLARPPPSRRGPGSRRFAAGSRARRLRRGRLERAGSIRAPARADAGSIAAGSPVARLCRRGCSSGSPAAGCACARARAGAALLPPSTAERPDRRARAAAGVCVRRAAGGSSRSPRPACSASGAARARRCARRAPPPRPQALRARQDVQVLERVPDPARAWAIASTISRVRSRVAWARSAEASERALDRGADGGDGGGLDALAGLRVLRLADLFAMARAALGR